MSSCNNPYIKTVKINFPDELLEELRKLSKKIDKDMSATVRYLVAKETNWHGQTNNITGYFPND